MAPSSSYGAVSLGQLNKGGGGGGGGGGRSIWLFTCRNSCTAIQLGRVCAAASLYVKKFPITELSSSSWLKTAMATAGAICPGAQVQSEKRMAAGCAGAVRGEDGGQVRRCSQQPPALTCPRIWITTAMEIVAHAVSTSMP
eukprot:COSAG03_NODE_336_length_8900_cov_32.176230_6_plen_141_part_00